MGREAVYSVLDIAIGVYRTETRVSCLSLNAYIFFWIMVILKSNLQGISSRSNVG